MRKYLVCFWTPLFWCLFFVATLWSCGGSGGGGGGSNGVGGGNSDAVDLSAEALTFNYSVGGTAPDDQIVTAWYDGSILEIGYPPGAGIPAWLSVSRVDYNDDRSPLEIRFRINTNSVTAGTHVATVRFVTSDLAWEVIGYRDMTVTCVAVNQLGVDTPQVEFTHTFSGADRPADQPVSVYGSNISWTAVADRSWVVLDATSGTTPSDLGVGVDPTGLAPGNHAATVTLRNASGSQVETLAVNLTVEPHQLIVGDNGVAFSSFPTAPSVLTHTVTVADNAGTATPWHAASDQAWLTLGEDGVTDGPLTLTADPSGLADDTVHYATVTVGSDDPSISNTEQIKVGLYVAGSDPSETLRLGRGGYFETDPVRPYVYVSARDADRSVVDIINIFTGQPVDRIDACALLRGMTISSDGETLYVYDDDDVTIVPIDLETRTATGKWSDFTQLASPYIRMNYARFNGKGVILTSSRQVVDADNGAVMVTLDRRIVSYHIVMAASVYDSSFYVIETGLSGYSFDLTRFAARYSVINDTFEASRSHRIATPFAAGDMAVSAEGTRIYMGWPLRAFVFDGETLTHGTNFGELQGRYLEIGPTGKLYFAVYDHDPIGVYSFNADDSADAEYEIPGESNRKDLKISGDGLRMISHIGETSSVDTMITAVSP